MKIVEKMRVSTPDRGVVRGDIVALTFLMALSLVAVWVGPGMGGGIPRGDSFAFFIPMYTFMGEQFRSGNIPGWNPYFFAGAPFAGDPESGWMYVPAMLLFTFLPTVAAYTVFTGFHLVLSGVSTYVFGRILRFNVMGSLVAAVIYLLSAGVEGAACCSVRTQVASWIPLAMLGVELAVLSTSWLKKSIAWTITGFAISQMLAGWLGQGSYYGLLAIGSYVAFRTLIVPPPHGRSMVSRLTALAATSVAILLIGFGLAAAGILPRIDAVSRSTQAGGEYTGAAAEAADTGGWHISLATFRLLSPDDVFIRYQLPGVVLALALVGLLVARKKSFAIYFFAYSLGFFILTLKPTPLHDFLYLFPMFQVLHEHVPMRALLVFSIGPAMLAGAAIDIFSRRRHSNSLLATAILLPPLFLMTIAYWLTNYDRDFSAPLFLGVFGGSLLLAISLVLGSLAGERSGVLRSIIQYMIPGLFILFIIADPTGRYVHKGLSEGRSFDRVDPSLTDLPCLDQVEGAARFLREQGEEEVFRYYGHDPEVMRRDDGRLWDYNGYLRRQPVQALLVGNQSLCLELQDVQGYNPVQVARYVEYMAALNGQQQEYHSSQVLPGRTAHPLLLALNTRYIVIPAADAVNRPDLFHLRQRYPIVYEDDDVQVLENEDAFPRAWIVHEAEQVPEGEALPLLTSGSLDLRQTVVLESEPPPLATPTDPSADSVTVTHFEPDHVELTASTDAPGLVVLSQMYDPGWRAYLDGEEIDVHVANHALSAVPLPAGEHEIELRYDPLPLRAGVAISGLTGLVMTGVFVLALVRWHRDGASTPRRQWRLSPLSRSA